MTQPPATSKDQPAFLVGGGEMGERMRAFDWAGTPVGPPAQWPQSLRSALSILLPSTAQIVLFWGPDFVTFYNDAYRPVFGAKHPDALGLPAREAWSEIWEQQLGALFEGVRVTGDAYGGRNLPFFLRRDGFLEETYFDVSYDPVRDESGDVGGIFCIVSETTDRILGERRIESLRHVAEHTAGAHSIAEAMSTAARALGESVLDVPFALLYELDDEGTRAVLAGTSGIDPGGAMSPREIDLADPAAAWPLARAAERGASVEVKDLAARASALPGGAWPESPERALVLPLERSGHARPAGFLVTAMSPRLRPDDAYRTYLGLLSSNIATAVANARAYDEESRRARALAELDQAKTMFFANVSHEFRTPLTLMLGPVEDLLAKKHTDLSPAATEQLDIVQRHGVRLLRLVNTLLDFSRLEAGRVRASYEPVDLATFTADLAGMFRSAIEGAGLRLEVEAEALGEPVWVDRGMWEKIVLNLLSNAFKFTFEGTIAVSLRRAEGHAELRVRDTGTGIAKEELPHLFERFHRIANARGRSIEGSGIGLALVQELVRFHGGSIEAESQPDRGSAFTVRIPWGRAHLPQEQVSLVGGLAAPSPGASAYLEEAIHWLPDGEDVAALPPAPEDNGPAGASEERPVVLVADDNADMRRHLKHLLDERYRVVTVSDGEAALAWAREQAPDLVLTDVMMPRRDGFGLLQALRDNPRTREIPVILLSARAGEESRVDGLEAGADDYLVKPFSSRELLARVSANLHMARVRRQATDALREADRRKDEFLAMLAHELRGPLAPLSNMLEVLKRAPANDELLDVARSTMERQLGQLVRLVDDLLDVNRITQDRLELRKERVDLSTVLLQAVESARPLAESMNHELTFTLPKQPVHLDADPARLAQVFHNLLHNACKYTPRQGHVSLSAERMDGEVVVRVRDSGLGIPAGDLERVFEMFAQVDRSLERSQGGLGIGLTLVRRLVEMHGGTVEARSGGPGKGSEFVVCLPVLVERNRRRVGREAGDAPVPAARRILVVDDNVDSAATLAMLLEVTGHEVHVAHDGLAAIELAAKLRPDVMLLDLGMPRLSGLDVARRIREESWGRDLTLIALTGWGQEDDRRRSKEAGFDAHFVKPVDVDALSRVLDALPPRLRATAREETRRGTGISETAP